MMTWVKRGLIVAALVGAVLVIVSAMQPKPLQVETVAVARGAFEQTIDEQGRTRVMERYTVSSPVAGVLRRVTLKAGDVIEEGAVLATIVPALPNLLDARSEQEARARLLGAEATAQRADAAREEALLTAQLASDEAKRMRSAGATGGVTSREVEQSEISARARVRTAEAAEFAARAARYDVEMARAALSQVKSRGADGARVFEIRAPVAGRVLRVNRDSEGPVSPGTALLEIANPQQLEVVVETLTRDAVMVSEGMSARLERWGGEKPLAARVRRVEPSGFTKISALGVEEQRVNVVLDIASPPEEWVKLGDGYRVEVSIVLFATHEGVKAPLSALFREGEAWQAFVAEGEVARRRGVTVERRGATEALVTGGLAEGDRVILHPPESLKDGAAITLLNGL